MRHVTVVDVDSVRLVPDQTLVISGNRIVAMGPTAGDAGRVRGRVIDLRGKYVIPGLWDMHTHLFGGETPGGTDVPFPLLIANGVTGVRDVAAYLDLLQFWRDEVRADRIPGPTIVGTGPLLDGLPPTIPGITTVITTPAHARREPRSLADRRADFLKAYDMLRPEVFFALLNEAKRVGIPVIGHVPLRVDAGIASDSGLRSIEHQRNIDLACSSVADSLLAVRTALIERSLGRLGVELRSEIQAAQRPRALETFDAARCTSLLQRFARNKTWQTPTLFLSVRVAFGWDTLPRVRAPQRFLPAIDRAGCENRLKATAARSAEQREFEKKQARWFFDLTKQMADLEVGLLAGTDISVPCAVPGFSLHEELRAMVAAGLTPAQVLHAATLGPAQYFGTADSIGTVTVGRRADLVILDADPLKDIANTELIRAVILRGRYLDRTQLDRMLAAAAAAAASGNSNRPKRPNTR